MWEEEEAEEEQMFAKVVASYLAWARSKKVA